MGDGCAYSTYSYVRDVREDKQFQRQLARVGSDAVTAWPSLGSVRW